MKTLLTKSAAKAALFIKRSHVVAFPTETVYGLGANVFDEKAINKIFELKARPFDNPLIIHISSKKQIELIASAVPVIARKIIDKFFPGPVSVIVKKNEIVPESVAAGLNTIAIRMPSSRLAHSFIKSSGVPIAAPSANLSGSPSPTTYRHVLEDFKGKIPCILVGPDARFGMESTVVDCTRGIPKVLRPGVVTIEQLKKIDSRIKLSTGGKVKSPGQKYRHYAPKASVIIVARPPKRPHLPRKVKGEINVIPLIPPPFPDSMTFIPSMALLPPPLVSEETVKPAYIGIDPPPDRRAYTVSLICKDAEDYARNLFSFFRKCDGKGIRTIYAQKVPEKGIGLAVMNRLKKAAH